MEVAKLQYMFGALFSMKKSGNLFHASQMISCFKEIKTTSVLCLSLYYHLD